ncbi:MAG TPA: CUAEP/CCAEP-tail radical SAM protein [Candidatus Saccharimonadales bacterium]|jgi:radical SAM superfamily enzyme YgiQ (UPF0313 family)|nr:CUAEP/CCAEP-tail radical SAM protein [Candidatus Saccharimonadales bacterium]
MNNNVDVVLVSTYELGRQPFGIASPAAWLREEGASVSVLDLSRQSFQEEPFAKADLIAFYLPMHTATRLAARIVGRVQRVNPKAHLCFFGLYAPVNEAYLRNLGAQTVLGGEFEEGLVSLVRRLAKDRGRDEAGLSAPQTEPVISLSRLKFKVPDRSGLPILSNYARLVIDGQTRVVGYTEATRGCKHVCRHCPIVPVYEGNFRVVQQEVVLEDIRRQVADGAQHITFGDPDFFNGPSHAVRIVSELHREFPALTYDVTIKVQHLIHEAQYLPVLRDTGCLFVTSAVESIDPVILEAFDKQHTREEFFRVVQNFREIGLTINPTFVTFTPWTTLVKYLDLLKVIADLDLIESVSSIQYAIRLLIPAGSKLLDLEEVRNLVGKFDEEALLYPWVHQDPMVDQLCKDILAAVEAAQAAKASRREIFTKVWRLASDALNRSTMTKVGLREMDEGEDGPLKRLAALPSTAEVPHLTENWYC